MDRKIWTDGEKKKLREMYLGDNKSIAECAEYFKRTYDAVKYKIKTLKLKKSVEQLNECKMKSGTMIWTPEEEKMLYKLLEKYRSISGVKKDKYFAKEHIKSYGVIRKKILEEGWENLLTNIGSFPANNRFTWEQNEAIMKDRNHMLISEIALRFGVTHAVIQGQVRMLKHTMPLIINILAGEHDPGEMKRRYSLTDADYKRYLEKAQFISGQMNKKISKWGEKEEDELFDLMENAGNVFRKFNSAVGETSVSLKTHDEYITVVFMGDWHLGSMYTDMNMVRKHSALIKNTKNCYMMFTGDANDNFLPSKGLGGEFDQTAPLKEQRIATRNAFRKCGGGDKVLAITTGCHMKESKVSMGDGTEKNIEDIKRGDRVLSSDGLPHKVEQTHINFHKGTVLKIRSQGNNEPLHVTWDHPCLVLKKKEAYKQNMLTRSKYLKYDAFKKEKLEEIRANDVEIGDFICEPIPKMIGVDSYKTIDGFEINESFMRLAGYWLAEGYYQKWRGKRKYLEFCFNITETNYTDEISDILDSMEVEYKISPRKARNTVNICARSRELTETFYKLFGEYSDRKFIHPSILECSPKILLNLFDAFNNGDGCVHLSGGGNLRSITTTISRNIMTGLHYILQKNGIINSVRQQNRKNRKFDDYQIHMAEGALLKMRNILDGQSETNYNRVASEQIVSDGVIWSRVKNIESEDFCGATYDITVDGPHDVVVNKRLVHNCHSSWSIQKDDYNLEDHLSRKMNIPYLGHGGTINLKCIDDGSAEIIAYRIRLMHKYVGGGAQNPTHCCRNYIMKEDATCDVVVTAHNHINAISEDEFQGKKKVLIRSGSYKPMDSFSETMNMAEKNEYSYAPAVVFNTRTKKMLPFGEMEVAIKVMQVLNKGE